MHWLRAYGAKARREADGRGPLGGGALSNQTRIEAPRAFDCESERERARPVNLGRADAMRDPNPRGPRPAVDQITASSVAAASGAAKERSFGFSDRPQPARSGSARARSTRWPSP